MPSISASVSTSSPADLNVDRAKFLAAKLLQRSQLKLVAASICDKQEQPQGTGTSSYFVRYQRMNLPLAVLSEGVTPDASGIELEEVVGGLDQWGDVIAITDVAILTTKHPLMQIATELLSDNAQRVIDREIQIIMLAGTNVQYGDGSVTTRAAVTSAMTVTDTLLHKARLTMTNNGAPPRDGPSNMKENATGQPATGGLRGAGAAYVAITSGEVTASIMKMASASGLWSSVVQYNNASAVYNAEVGMYLGFRWVETNFIPKFVLLGNETAAVVSGNAFGTDTPIVTAVASGGSLTSATAYYFKVTRKKKDRGFEEAISMRHSMTSGAGANDESFTFNFTSLTDGYVYNLYFGASDSDAALGLHTENIEEGTVVTVTSVPALTTTAPANISVGGTDPTALHPVFILSSQALAWTGLQQLKSYVVGAGATKDDPLDQIRTVGYKFMAKACILDQTRILRLELATSFD